LDVSLLGLQSRFASMGTSCDVVLNEARKVHAEQLLQWTEGSMIDIAMQLGFS